MGNDVFTLIILCLVIICYALDKIPLVITALLSMLVLYFKGVISVSDAFSGFSNNAVIMLIGMQIIGIAMTETGIVNRLSKAIVKSKLFGRKGFSEKKFLIFGGLIIAALSTVINPTLIVLMFMEIVDGMVAQGGSDITRKNTYLPICISSTCGCMFTSISSTTVIVTSSLIAESSAGRALGFLEPMAIGVPALVVYLLFVSTFGHKMMQKCFDYEDIKPNVKEKTAENKDVPKWKMYLTLGVLAVCIGFFIFSDYSMGAISLAGAAILILTGCVSVQKAFGGVKWQTVVLVACALGFAKGVATSGAGLLIANGALAIFGDLAKQPFFLCMIALVVSSIISNLMNNSSAAALLVPIFITLAEQTGINVIPVAMAAGVGANLAMSTPICAPVFTIASSAGYRFKDYFRVGGLINLACIIVSAVALYFLYFVF